MFGSGVLTFGTRVMKALRLMASRGIPVKFHTFV
jgi:hypothetical protein